MNRGPVCALLAILSLAACASVPDRLTPVPQPTEIPVVTINPPPTTPAPTTPTPAAPETGQPTRAPSVSPTPLPLSTDTPAPPATDAAPTSGPPAAACVNGWVAPAPGTPEYEEAIELLEATMGVAGPWDVAEMRYFTGPDAPWMVEPRYEAVERWYVRASLAEDPAFNGRWLLEKRTETINGVAAVAPYESAGYASPDWTGFVGEGPPTHYLGLPGEWSGIPYDFVTGEGDSGQPGLPDEVVGCLEGT